MNMKLQVHHQGHMVLWCKLQMAETAPSMWLSLVQSKWQVSWDNSDYWGTFFI